MSGARHVSLWWAPLDLPGSGMRELEACLSPEERRRADGFQGALGRHRFIAARGWLRHLLAGQIGCAPLELPLPAAGPGKPRLGSDCGLRFNASRSGGLALYATSWEAEVGVDVEKICAATDVDGLAVRFFSPADGDALAALTPTERLFGTFRCWTRREAYGKAIGVGLGRSLQTVSVGIEGRREVAPGWSVQQVEVAPGFAAAVAGADLGGWSARCPRQVGLWGSVKLH